MVRIISLVWLMVTAFPRVTTAECITLNVATMARYADAIFSGRVTSAGREAITFKVDRVSLNRGGRG